MEEFAQTTATFEDMRAAMFWASGGEPLSDSQRAALKQGEVRGVVGPRSN
jgi:hypothetical protein